MNRTRRIGSNTFLPFRKIDEDSGGSVSCDTQLNCRTLFPVTTALLSQLFFGPLFGWSSAIQCGNEHPAPNYTRGRMPILTKRFGASTFQEVSTRRSIVFSCWRLPLAFLFLDTLLPRVFEDCGSESGSAFGVGFARSLLSCQKLHGSSFEHCTFPSTGNIYLFLFQHHLISCDS